MRPCKDSRCETEPCHALNKNWRCIALRECDAHCTFYKPKSVREIELEEMRKRKLATYYGI